MFCPFVNSTQMWSPKSLVIINDGEERYKADQNKWKVADGWAPVESDLNFLQLIRDRIFWTRREKELVILEQLLKTFKRLDPKHVLSVGTLNASKLPPLEIDRSVKCLHIARLTCSKPDYWSWFDRWLYRYPKLEMLLICDHKVEQHPHLVWPLMNRSTIKTIFLATQRFPENGFTSIQQRDKLRVANFYHSTGKINLLQNSPQVWQPVHFQSHKPRPPIFNHPQRTRSQELVPAFNWMSGAFLLGSHSSDSKLETHYFIF